MSCDIIQVTVSEVNGTTSVVEVGQGNIHNDLLGLQGGVSGQYFHLTSGQHANLLNAQLNTFNLSGVTSGSGLIELIFDETGVIEVPTGKSILFRGEVSAFDVSDFRTAAWEYKCLLANKTGTVEKIGFSQLFKIADDSSGVWAVYVNQNTGVNYFQLNVQGENSSTIKWISSVETISIS